MIRFKGIQEPLFVMEEVQDPAINARAQKLHDQFWKNVNWLESHWNDLLPDAIDRFVVVAGQEAFVADTPEEAWARARQAHPDDCAPYGKFVREKGRLIYANHR